MRYKKLMILSIFLVSLLAVSAVSATDNVTSDIVSAKETTDEVVSVENDTQVIDSVDFESGLLSANSDGTFTDLANEIANANGELKLTKNYVYDSSKDSNYKNGIVINKEITINGRGFIINGNNAARAFMVSNNNVILRNIEFINCTTSSYSSYSGYGGAVYWNGDNGNLFDCSFTNCHGTDYAGAVYWNGYNGALSDCRFTNCYSTTSGGAVYWNGYNGALSDCNFTNCYISATSSSGGAVYWNGDNGALSDCNFTNCYIYSPRSYIKYGGAVYWAGANGALSDCSFMNCYVYGSGSTSGSYSTGYGGAVYWNGANGALSDCSFMNCYISSYGSYSKYGGAVYWKGATGVLDNCSFISCHIYNNGLAHAVYWYGTEGFLLNCSFIDSNSSSDKKDSIYWYGNKGNLFNCSFNGNYYDYEKYCSKDSNAIVHPVMLIHTSTLNDDDRIAIFEITPLLNNISVEIYNVTDKKTLYEKFNISSEDLTSSYTVNYLEEGEYQIYLNYNGDDFYSSYTANDLFKIGENSSYEVSVNNFIDIGDDVYLNLTLNEDATGKVKLTLSDYTCINEMAGGKASFNIPYTIGEVTEYKIKYVGDDKYNPIYINGTFVVSLNLTSEICLDLKDNYIFDENIPLNYNITPNCTGNISIYVDDAFIDTISVGEVFELENIDAGEHNITLIYNGDKYFTPCNDTAVITVAKANPSINVTSYNRVGNVLFEVILNEKATGNITLTINNEKYSETLINGKANVTVSLPQGIYTGNVYYMGDGNYNSSSATVNVVVNKMGTSISASDVSVGYGDVGGELVAGLSDADGNPIAGAEVSVILDNAEYPLITDSDGQVSVSTSELAAGSYVASIVYDGDDNYESSSATVNVVVNKMGTSISASDVSVGYGDVGGELIATLTDADGNPITGAEVSVILDNAEYPLITDSDGQVSVSTSELAAGSYTASITYDGDNNYNPSTANAKVTVKANIDISAVYDADAKEAVVTLINSATGMALGGADVQVNINGTTTTVKTNSKGQAKVSTADLPAGTYTATFFYAGNSKLNSANTTLNIVVCKVRVVISAPDVTVVYGDPNGELVATITDADGNPLSVNLTVNFNKETYNVTSDSEGKVSIPIGVIAPKTYVATISFEGDDIYAASSTTANVVVSKADTSISAVDMVEELVVSLTNEYGKPLVTANVVVNVNGVDYALKTDSKGQAKFSKSDLEIGTYTATVSYAGNNKYNPSDASVVITVKSGTNIVAPDVNVVYLDESGELVATLTNETNSKGQVKVSTSGLAVGNYIAFISYNGNTKYNPSTATVNVIVGKGDVDISAPDVSVAYLDDGELVATLTNVQGKVLSGANVIVNLNGVDYALKTNSKGQVKVSTSGLAPKNYVATISYAGNNKYNPSSVTANVIVGKGDVDISAPDVSVAYLDDGELVVTLTNVQGKVLSGANVIVNLNGVDYALKTDSKGQVKVSTSGLVPKAYVATVSYAGNSKYKPSSVTANVVVNKASTSISAIDNGEELIATLTNEYGKALSSANVVVNLNGVDYAFKTNSKGQVKVSIADLDPKEYVATFSYAGNSKYSSAATTINAVEGKTTTNISTAYNKETSELITTLTNTATGNGIKGAKVVVKINGVKNSLTTDSKGQVKISTVEFDPNIYTIISSYPGNSKYTATSTTKTIFIKN